MDMAIIPCSQMYVAARHSGVNIPLRIVHYPTNIQKFTSTYTPLHIPDLAGCFTFYTIADFTRRKNLAALLKAFHTEFTPNEPVQLLLKVSRYGMDSEQIRDTINELCHTVKSKLKLYKNNSSYKQEIILSSYLDESTLYSLHNTCDCFVLPSYGESWSLSAFDAMGFGKTPIVTNAGGFIEYINNNNGWLVDCVEEEVFGMTDSLPHLFTGRENWYKVSVDHLRWCMRQAYEHRDLQKIKAKNGRERIEEFSYQQIGAQLVKVLSYVK
jgi:glycosyltransferase involved in cell wall biosynthesis